MAMKTFYAIQPFEKVTQGRLKVLQPVEAQSKDQCIRKAESLAKKGGAIAFARTGDPEVGDFDDAAEILGRFGEVPQDFAGV